MNLRPGRTQFLVFCLALLAVCAITVQAQSGRRQPKPPPAAPVQEPTPEPTPTPRPPQKESDIGFVLGADSLTAFNSFPLGYYDLVLQSCGDRLRSASSAHVTVAQEPMSRG